jgi:hypothetical protein
VENEIDRVFYMSPDMIYNLDRNGCVLIMDSTHKTNRFYWPLLLVCGINEHFQTVLLAVALIHYQTTESFAWVLQKMKEAVSAEAWQGVCCVTTDGDAAMEAAIEEVLPHAQHLRCWYHLEQNLRHNLSRLLGNSFDLFLGDWKNVAAKETTEEHLSARAELHKSYPAAVPYLEKNIWKNDEMFAACYTKRWCTLGVLSTQRVEGMNAKLKGMLHVNSKTALSSLFQTLEYAASEIDLAAVRKMEELDREQQKEAYVDTFSARIRPHLTRYAQGKVQEQFDLMHNYRAVWNAELRQWHVQKFRDEEAIGVRRTTRAEQARPAECSCFFPAIHQLPCRHVMCLNQALMLYPFQRTQVAARWLRSYRPPQRYLERSSSSVSSSSSAVQPETQPSYLPTQVLRAKVPSQKRRYGELKGVAERLVACGADNPEIYFQTLAKLQELCRWVEAAAAGVTAVTFASGPAAASSVSGQPASSTAAASDPQISSLTTLHPTLSIEETKEPSRPRKKRGREQERRFRSQGEETGGRNK